MVAFALASFFLKKQWKQKRKAVVGSVSSIVWPGLDSEFYAVERSLARRGLERQAAESVGAWLNRIRGRAANPDKLRRLASLHLKYRFDPQGLTADERDGLRADASEYLRELKRR
jgi:hypothetical protein